MRRCVIGCWLVAALLSGCAGLMREPRPTVWLGLEPSLPDGGLRSGGPTLEVAAFATSEPFATDRVASRDGSSRWSFANYHLWMAEPGEILGASVREYLGGCDLFGAVVTPPAPFDPDYRLGGAVRELYWDRSRKAAVLEFEAALIAGTDRFLGFWVYRAEEPVSGDDVDSFLRAASSGASRLLAELARDLHQTLTAARP